jgi:glycerol-1-phosphate dehydrogenase [NAD(P)+]
MVNDGMSALQDLLHKHSATRELHLYLTHRVAEAPTLLQQHYPACRWTVVADATTAHLAGAQVADALSARLVVVAPRSDGSVVAGQAEANEVARQLQTSDAQIAVAVGSGTINDLTKFASHQVGIPAAVVATAPSMNGYTSACAALLDDGIKVSLPCAPPRITVVPVDLLCQAPSRMIAAGFADLRSRPVSGADWYLGHRLLGTPYSADALQLVDEAERLTASAVEEFARRTPAGVMRLSAALLLSGMAMDIAGTSAPSSGGEHLISHYLDMWHYAHGGPQDLHGCQVGVATLAAAQLYERLLSTDILSLESPQHEPWDAVAERLACHFGALWPAVEPIAHQVHGDDTSRRNRLQLLCHDWPATRQSLRDILGADSASTGELLRAGAPVRFAEIGVSTEGARAALLHARFVRTRYTILDLAAELGVLESWVDDLLSMETL